MHVASYLAELARECRTSGLQALLEDLKGGENLDPEIVRTRLETELQRWQQWGDRLERLSQEWAAGVEEAAPHSPGSKTIASLHSERLKPLPGKGDRKSDPDADSAAVEYKQVRGDEETSVSRTRGPSSRLPSSNGQQVGAKDRCRGYQQFFEMASEAYLLSDLAGAIENANMSAAALLGASSPEALRGQLFSQFISPSQQESFCQRLGQLPLHGDCQSWEVLLRSFGDERGLVPVTVRVQAIASPGERARSLCWILRDASELSQVSAALHLSEQKFRALFHRTFQLMGILHPDGRIIEMNQTALSFGGTTTAATVGKWFWETRWWRRNPQESARLQREIAKAARGQFSRYIAQMRRSDGTLVPVDFSLKPVKADATGHRINSSSHGHAVDEVGDEVALLIFEGREIGDRLLLEQKLLREQNISNSILKSLPGIFYLIEGGTNFVRWNQEFERVSGYSAAEIARLSPIGLFLPGEQSRVARAMNTALREGEVRFEATLVSKSGQGTTYCFTGVNLVLEERPYLLGVGIDISDRTSAQAALQQSEERYRSVVNSVREAIFQTDAKGHWTFLNAAWTQITGFTCEESLGTHFGEYLVKENSSSTLPQALSLVRGCQDFCQYETELWTKDGNRRWVEVIAKQMRGCSGEIEGTTGTISDVTDRKLAQDQLRAVIDTVPGLVSWIDRDGCYLGVNRRLADALNLPPEEFIGKQLGFLPDGNSSAFVEFMERFLESTLSTASQVIEIEIGNTSRSYLIVAQRYQQGDATVLVGIDVTERKQAEMALRESEEKFRQLAENIEQVFWMTDLHRQEMLYVSPAYEKTWGRTLASAYSSPQTWMEAIHPEDRKRVALASAAQIRGEADATDAEPGSGSGIDRCVSPPTLLESNSTRNAGGHSAPGSNLQGGRQRNAYQVYDIEYRILHPEGEVRWIRDRAFPVRDRFGQIYRLAGIAEDITERKRAKEALHKRERYLSALVAVQRQLLAAPTAQLFQEGERGEYYAHVLAILGQTIEAGRIYVYENYRSESGQLRARTIAQWWEGADGKPIHNRGQEDLSYEVFPRAWEEKLRHGELIQGQVADLTPSQALFFTNRGALSFLMLPLLVRGGRFFGFIGFERTSDAKVWQPLEIGLLSSVAAALSLAKERQLTQEEMQRQLTAIETATDGILIVGTREELRYVNPAYRCMLGYEAGATQIEANSRSRGRQVGDDELLESNWYDHYPPQEQKRLQEEVVPTLVRSGRWSGEAIARRRDGTTFIEELSLTLTETGEIVGVCRDISDRKQAESQLKASLEEKDLLLKEVHHRVKNNLQVISSILSLQSQALSDARAIAVLEESQNRIASMALIHERLYQSENLAQIDFAEYIRELAYNLLGSYNIDSSRIETNLRIDDVKLSLDTAIPCGLAINELVSNSLKHAFPEGREGRVAIELRSIEEASLLLRVEDNGVGLPEEFDRKRTNSLGLSLITSLTRQLRGQLEMGNHEGAYFQIVFPQPKTT